MIHRAAAAALGVMLTGIGAAAQDDPPLVFTAGDEVLAIPLGEASAEAIDGTSAGPVVLIALVDRHVAPFAQLTARHVGEVMELAVCGKPAVAPLIREMILGGRASITGDYTLNEVRALAQSINEGCDATTRAPGPKPNPRRRP